MSLPAFSDSKLIFITGKGGVGKSTIAATLALKQSLLNKKTALIEIAPENSLHKFFALSPIKDLAIISKKLSIFRINLDAILRELFIDQFKFKMIFDTLIDNKFVKHFLGATPGFNEFLIMGKIQKIVNSSEFDTVIVDAPSTGHFIALLEIPKIVSTAIESGPLKDIALNTYKLITDKNKTSIIVTTTPEEMPTTEAIHIRLETKKKNIFCEHAVMNRLSANAKLTLPSIKTSKANLKILENLIKINKQINANEEKSLKAFEKVFKKNIIKLPELEIIGNHKLIKDLGNYLT